MTTSFFAYNLIYLIGGFLNVGIAIFVLAFGRKKMTSTMLMFGLFCIAVSVFQFSQVLGADAPDAATARSIFMFNLTDLFIGMFWTHWFLAMIGGVKRQRWALGGVYASGLGLLAFFLAFPRMFLVDPVPKLYLPYYYEPGRFYWVMVAWFFLIAVYYFYQMFKAYRAEHDPVQKNRYKYVLASMIYAFLVGTTAFALVFDIPVDPLIGSFCGFYTITLAYAIVRYELLDIRILAKRAFVYAMVMIVVGVVIAVTNLLGNYLSSSVPGFPQWLVPTIISILVGGSGIYIWRKAREADILKYEFVSVIMHKFRTPLTQIRWAAESIAAEREALSAGAQQALDIVAQANSHIGELTSALASLNDEDDQSYAYSFKTFDLDSVTGPLLQEYRPRYAQKSITVSVAPSAPEDRQVYSDPDKIRFAMDILINNAWQYTPQGGSVSIAVKRAKDAVAWTIADNGIGISKESGALIFSKFYRGDNAKKTSTEGTGIGLYLAREIVRKGGGSLTFSSEGIGKGATFVMTLPVKA